MLIIHLFLQGFVNSGYGVNGLAHVRIPISSKIVKICTYNNVNYVLMSNEYVMQILLILNP